MIVQLADELKRRLLYGEGIEKGEVSLRITVEKISPGRGRLHETEIVVHIVDANGIPLATIDRRTLREGDTLTLDTLRRAFDIHIS